MPPLPPYKPFPSPHRIGTDICNIPRVLSLLRGRNGHNFIRRILRIEERKEVGGYVDGVLGRWRRLVLERERGREMGRERGFVRFGLEGKGMSEGLGFGLGFEGVRRRGMWDVGSNGEKGNLESVEQKHQSQEQKRADKLWKGMEDGNSDGRVVDQASPISTSSELDSSNQDRDAIPEIDIDTINASPTPENHDHLDKLANPYPDYNGSFSEVQETKREEEEEAAKMEDEGWNVKMAEDGTERKSDTTLLELDKEWKAAEKDLEGVARFLAGRFAAKEAIMKAWSSRRLTFHSILILKPQPKEGVEGSVAPVAIVMPEGEYERTLKQVGGVDGNGQGEGEGKGGDKDTVGGKEREERGKEVRISISHDGDYATAVCLVVDE